MDPPDNVMVGNPQHGIYVSKARMDKIPSEKAKDYMPSSCLKSCSAGRKLGHPVLKGKVTN